jgi:hypothetical protein
VYVLVYTFQESVGNESLFILARDSVDAIVFFTCSLVVLRKSCSMKEKEVFKYYKVVKKEIEHINSLEIW